MKNVFIALAVLCFANTIHATGRVGPYIYEYSGDPTAVSTSIIDPIPGSIIIDNSTTHRAIKLSAKGSNATFAGQNFIVSGTLSLGGTTGAVTAIATLPGNGGSYIFTSAQIICTTGTNVTAAPSVQIVSGTGNTALSGTGTVLTGTASSTYTVLTPQAAATIVTTGTGGVTLSAKIATTGTSSGTFTGKAFIHGYWLP